MNSLPKLSPAVEEHKVNTVSDKQPYNVEDDLIDLGHDPTSKFYAGSIYVSVDYIVSQVLETPWKGCHARTTLDFLTMT